MNDSQSAIDIKHEIEELHEIARALGGSTRSSIQEIVDRIESAVRKSREPVVDENPWKTFNAALVALQKSHQATCPGGRIHLGTMLINDGEAERAYQKRRAARAKRKSR